MSPTGKVAASVDVIETDFSADKLDRIRELYCRMGLEYRGLDILRELETGISITVDVDRTPLAALFQTMCETRADAASVR